MIVAATEGRDVAIADVAIADVKGDFLKADMGDLVLMKLEGATVNIMCELDLSLV